MSISSASRKASETEMATGTAKVLGVVNVPLGRGERSSWLLSQTGCGSRETEGGEPKPQDPPEGKLRTLGKALAFAGGSQAGMAARKKSMLLRAHP